MKKTLLLLLLGFFQMTNANSQCCPYLGDIYISPENPSATDSVFLITYVTTPNQGTYFGYDITTMPDNNITVKACYFEGFLTAPQFFYDSINIGVLSDGLYTIDFVALNSINDQSCMANDSMEVAVNFEVGETSNTTDDLRAENLKVTIFPNPVTSDVLRLVSEQLMDEVRVLDAYGNVLLEERPLLSKEETLDLSGFASGVYFIQVSSHQGVAVIRRMVKL